MTGSVSAGGSSRRAEPAAGDDWQASSGSAAGGRQPTVGQPIGRPHCSHLWPCAIASRGAAAPASWVRPRLGTQTLRLQLGPAAPAASYRFRRVPCKSLLLLQAPGATSARVNASQAPRRVSPLGAVQLACCPGDAHAAAITSLLIASHWIPPPRRQLRAPQRTAPHPRMLLACRRHPAAVECCMVQDEGESGRQVRMCSLLWGYISIKRGDFRGAKRRRQGRGSLRQAVPPRREEY